MVASESAGEVDDDNRARVIQVTDCWQNLGDRAANGSACGMCRHVESAGTRRSLPAATLEEGSGQGGGRRRWVWCQEREKGRLVDGAPLLLLVLVMVGNGFLPVVEWQRRLSMTLRRAF